MACQLIRARETLFTPQEGADKRLFAGVRADVAGLWWEVRVDEGRFVEDGTHLVF